jgi:hypothetical protein
MKFRLLLSVASGVLIASGTAVWVMACDKDGKSATAAVATANSSTCTAAMAAKCTPAQAAACRAKTTGVSAVTADVHESGCPYAAAMKSGAACPHATSAAAHAACAEKMSATTASAHGACASKAKAATAAHDCCASKTKASAVTAMSVDDDVVFMPAGAGHSCASKGVKATSAGAGHSCASKTSATAGNGYSCGGKGVTAMAGRSHHADCDACADMSDCDGELRSSGAITQVVRLKNGIMYVYTAQEAGKVRAVQAAVAQRNDRLVAMTASGDKAKLCPDCKLMRGAMASGKLTREMVSIEGGCMMLVTSSDKMIVSKLHSMMEHASNHAKI